MSPRGISAAERARLAALAVAEERRRRRTLVVVGVVVAVALLVAAGLFWRQQALRHGTPTAVSVAPDAGGPQAVVDGQPIRLGDPAARHVVVVWEDAHCPHCATLESRIGSTLTDAVRAGTARLELYPLRFIDDGSARASAALACAAEQGIALDLHSGLWRNPDSAWETSQLASLARGTAGAAGEATAQCVERGDHAGWVTSLDDAARSAGVDATPTLFVDGAAEDVATLDSSRLSEALR